MSTEQAEAPFAYDGLDRVFHEKARLGIVTSLAGHADGVTFSQLKTLCALTDGNLNRHLQVLEEAGYVVLSKDQSGRRPVTTCRLTASGREQFSAYLDTLEQVLRQAQASALQPGSGGLIQPA